MSDTRAAGRPISWWSIAAMVVEAVVAGAPLAAVYAIVVVAGRSLLGQNWQPALWIAAAVISGFGMTGALRLGRNLAGRLVPAAGPRRAPGAPAGGARPGAPARDAEPPLARMLADGAAAGFVTTVYVVVVAGGIAALGSDWQPVLWIAAPAIAGAGTTAVRSGTWHLAHRLLAPASPFAILTAAVSGAATAGPAEEAMSRLARMLAERTAARGVAVWLAAPAGELHCASSWPERAGPDEAATARDVTALEDLASVDLAIPVRHLGELVGALTLRAGPDGSLAAPDVRLAEGVAGSAGELLHNEQLTGRLRAQLDVETALEAELAAARHRVEAAKYAAREQLSREIGAAVCGPLERCREHLAAILPGLADPAAAASTAEAETAAVPLAARLAEITREIDTAITDFRRIVHGVYPPVLTDHGLRAALESLLSDIDPQATLAPPRVPRLDGWVEAGAYFCAAALLREWDVTGARQPMWVGVGVTTSRISLEFVDTVAADGATSPAVSQLVLDAVRDRVTALGGSLELGNVEPGRALVVTVPLEPEWLSRHTGDSR